MEGVEKVIHAAAVVSFWPRKYAEMLRINVKGTANVVDMALEHKVKKLVHVSSIAAIGRYPGIGKITAQTKWKDNRLNSQYATSKHNAELQVQRAVAEGLPAVIVNPSLIVGPSHDWNLGTARFWTMVNNGLKFYNKGTTGFVSVQDVARASALLLDHGPSEGERFILAAENLEYKLFLSWVAQSIQRKAPTVPASFAMVRIAGLLSEWRGNLTGKEPLVTRESARIGSNSFEYDGAPILFALKQAGFQYASIEQTVIETGKAFLKRNGN
jgi:nucleoside-diphosphate-sugar epimerase